MSDLVAEHKNKIERFVIPCLTDEQQREYKKAKKCMFCKISFAKLPKNKKCRHHDHSVKPVYVNEIVNGKLKVTCTSGNYIGASCASCNLHVTSKRNDAPMLFHNFSGYDSSAVSYTHLTLPTSNSV